MVKRIKTGAISLVALGALALGGSAFAGAVTPAKAPPAAPQSRVDTPDRGGAADTPDKGERTSGKDTDKVQNEGGNDAKDSGAEAAGEKPGSESAPGNDGPGGHADEPGNANANTQQQGTK